MSISMASNKIIKLKFMVASLMLCWVVPAIAAIFLYRGYMGEVGFWSAVLIGWAGIFCELVGVIILLGEFICLSEFYGSTKMFWLRIVSNIIPVILWGFNTAMTNFLMDRDGLKWCARGELVDPGLNTMMTAVSIMGVATFWLIPCVLFYLIYGMHAANSSASNHQSYEEFKV